MILDFTFSIQDWLDAINKFLTMFEDFFASLGVTLFDKDEDEE